MSAPPVAVRYSSRERLAVLTFSFLGTVFDGADFASFILFLAPLAADFHTSLLGMEAIQASSYLAGIAGALLFGLLADRYGRRAGMATTVAVYSLASLASAFAPNYGALFALRLVAGLGIGGEAGLAIAYLNEAWHPRRRGVASAGLQGMFLVGSAVATALFTWTDARFGADAWRWSFGLLGAGALLAAAVRLWMPESRVWLSRTDPGRRQAARALWPALRSAGLLRLTALLAGLTTCTFFAAYAVETYAPSTLLTVYRLTPAAAGSIVFLALAVILVAYLVFGALSDRWGRRAALAAASAFGVIGFLGYGVLWASRADLGPKPGTLPAATLIALLWMLAAAGPLGVQGAWFAELYPTEVRAAAVNVAYYVGRGLGGGLAPLAALAVAQRLGGDLRLAMLLGLVGVLVAPALVLRLPETRGQPLRVAVGGAEAVVPE